MAEFITICPVEEIPNGKREVFDINGRWVAIFCVDNRFYAIEDACTHDGNILTEDAKGNPIPSSSLRHSGWKSDQSAGCKRYTLV
jgi:nitrite reductase/ring-hydroxylating ferredoxin subunit